MSCVTSVWFSLFSDLAPRDVAGQHMPFASGARDSGSLRISYRQTWGSRGLRGPASFVTWMAMDGQRICALETGWNCDKVLNKELSTRGPILGKSKHTFPTEGWWSPHPGSRRFQEIPGAPAPSPIIQDGPCKTNLISMAPDLRQYAESQAHIVAINMLPGLSTDTELRKLWQVDELLSAQFYPVLPFSAMLYHVHFVMAEHGLAWRSVTWDPCRIVPVQLDRCAHNAMTYADTAHSYSYSISYLGSGHPYPRHFCSCAVLIYVCACINIHPSIYLFIYLSIYTHICTHICKHMILL